MHPVKVNKISGFRADAPVCVYEKRGGEMLPFYQFPDSTEFNLPVGNFYSDCKLTELKKPILYKCPELEKPEKKIKIPVKNELTFTHNPNKCSVIKAPEATFIYMDEKFKKYPRQMQIFILFHELGHYLYYSEDLCDIYSASLMLKKGYNPSQCYHSSHHNLENLERKNTLLKFLQNVTTK